MPLARAVAYQMIAGLRGMHLTMSTQSSGQRDRTWR